MMINSALRSRSLLRACTFLAAFLAVGYAAVVMFNEDRPLAESKGLSQKNVQAEAPAVYFTLSKDECLAKNRAWNLQDSSCISFTDLSLCNNLDGEWEYPAKCQ